MTPEQLTKAFETIGEAMPADAPPIYTYPLTRDHRTKEMIPVICAMADCFGGAISIRWDTPVDYVRDILVPLGRKFVVLLHQFRSAVNSPVNPPNAIAAINTEYEQIAHLRRVIPEGRVVAVLREREGSPCNYLYDRVPVKWQVIAHALQRTYWINEVLRMDRLYRAFLNKQFPDARWDISYQKNMASPFANSGDLRIDEAIAAPDNWSYYPGSNYTSEHCQGDTIAAWVSVSGKYEEQPFGWNHNAAMPAKTYHEMGAHLRSIGSRLACIVTWPQPLIGPMGNPSIESQRWMYLLDGLRGEVVERNEPDPNQVAKPGTPNFQLSIWEEWQLWRDYMVSRGMCGESRIKHDADIADKVVEEARWRFAGGTE